jgi:very-short-patch-repair endonuclease
MNGPGDPAAAWVAGQQLELIKSAQLRAAGISKDQIATRRRRGTLHRVHHGVYLFGSPIMLPSAQELAAVLACGEASLVSHRSAAALWGLASAPKGIVDVTVVGSRRRQAGLRLHRAGALDPADRGAKNGIPVTSPARALLELASQAAPYEVERAIGQAYALELVTEAELQAAVARAPRVAGAGALKAELQREGGPQWTQSEGERRMLRLIRAAKLPHPKTQEWIAGWPADFVWLDERLIVEVDGFKFHGHRQAFERDRRRDQAHITEGYRVIRVTWRQLCEEPIGVAVMIARALALAQAG